MGWRIVSFKIILSTINLLLKGCRIIRGIIVLLLLLLQNFITRLASNSIILIIAGSTFLLHLSLSLRKTRKLL